MTENSIVKTNQFEIQSLVILSPNQNIEIKPKPNTLVFFPGNLEFLHGVKPMINDVRYTLTSFWTFDKLHKMNGYENSTMSIGSNS